MDLTVVIPAFNEARRLPSSLDRVCSYLEGRSLAAEVLVVDDGSADETAAVAEGFAGRGVRVLRLPANRGKGAATREGVLASRGARVLLCDADLSTPIEDLERLERRLADAPVVLGSRAVDSAEITRRQPIYREMMGKVFNAVIRLLGLTGLHDTQCGFKLLEGAVARRLFTLMTIDRFAFDVELVWLARREGHAVVEEGVRWENSPASTVSPVGDSLSMLRDVLIIRWRHRGRAPAGIGERVS